MSKTIQFTDEQWDVLQRGESITIEPPKPQQWEPKGGRFYVNGWGDVGEGIESSMRRRFGLEYPTQALAARAADLMRVHHRLVAYALEHWPDYEVPETGLPAYFPEYDVQFEEWDASCDVAYRNPWIPYGPREKVEELVDKLNRGEVVL